MANNASLAIPAVINSIVAYFVAHNPLYSLLLSQHRTWLIILAVAGAATGSVCAIITRLAPHAFLKLLTMGLCFTAATYGYWYISEFPGPNNVDVAIAYLLMFIIFGIAGYLLTLLEM